MRSVEWFYDFGSAYSFLALHRIEAVCEENGATLQWRPFLLGAVFKATGNQPPATIAAKAVYLLKDLNDWARHYGISWRMPSNFPPNTLTALRGAYVAEEVGVLIPYTKRVFQAYWQEDRDIRLPEVLAALAEEVGVPRSVWGERIAAQEIKDRLRTTTDEAIRRGAFGAPTFFLDHDNMFWGNDRIPLLVEALRRPAGPAANLLP